MQKDFNKQKLTSIFLIILGCILVGSGPIIIKLSNIQNPFLVVYYRMYIASSIFIFYCLITKTKIKISKNNNILGLLAGFFLATDLSLYYTSMHYTAISNASLIGNLAPIFVVAISWLFLNQKPNKSVVFGILVAIIGLIILVGFDTQNDYLFGNGMALLGAFFYGIYFLYLMIMIKNIGSLLTNFYVTLYCSIFCFIFLLFYNLNTSNELYQVQNLTELFWQIKSILMPQNSTQFYGLVLNSLLAQVFGQGLIMKGLKNLTPSFGSMVLLSEPVATIFLCSFILCDTLSNLQIIGGFIILSSIVLVNDDNKNVIDENNVKKIDNLEKN